MLIFKKFYLSGNEREKRERERIRERERERERNSSCAWELGIQPKSSLWLSGTHHHCLLPPRVCIGTGFVFFKFYDTV